MSPRDFDPRFVCNPDNLPNGKPVAFAVRALEPKYPSFDVQPAYDFLEIAEDAVIKLNGIN